MDTKNISIASCLKKLSTTNTSNNNINNKNKSTSLTLTTTKNNNNDSNNNNNNSTVTKTKNLKTIHVQLETLVEFAEHHLKDFFYDQVQLLVEACLALDNFGI
jgi:hypothetical protein